MKEKLSFVRWLQYIHSYLFAPGSCFKGRHANSGWLDCLHLRLAYAVGDCTADKRPGQIRSDQVIQTLLHLQPPVLAIYIDLLQRHCLVFACMYVLVGRVASIN